MLTEVGNLNLFFITKRCKLAMKNKLHKILIMSFLILLTYTNIIFANDVVIVEGKSYEPYEKAIEGFQSTCNCTIKEVLSVDILDVYTTRKIYEAKPEMIVAVGEKALKEVANIKDIPILYTMVLHPYSIVQNKDNISGISMRIPANKQLTVFLDVLPQVKTIGVLYTSDEEREILPSIKGATCKHGVTIYERLVDKPQSIPAILADMQNKIDALWILPNTKIVYI